jgi:hypothetical protein
MPPPPEPTPDPGPNAPPDPDSLEVNPGDPLLDVDVSDDPPIPLYADTPEEGDPVAAALAAEEPDMPAGKFPIDHPAEDPGTALAGLSPDPA